MKISLVVPVFNEQDTVLGFHQAVRSCVQPDGMDVEIVFINDGSQDNTENICTLLVQTDPLVKLVNFTRNFGKEPALFAGLATATGDAVIPIDVDLQDPIEVIPLMIQKWQQGADVVLARRRERHLDTFLKRKSAEWFYSLHNVISQTALEKNVGDFRLLNRATVDHILALPERNLFMKGILSWVGGKVDVVEYSRNKRSAGKTKFNGWKLWNLALEGITSFSTLPLRIWSYIGTLVALCAFIYGGWMIIDKIIFGNPVKGYPSLIVSILFLGGVQLIGIGVLGEYIGRIYMETKRRPRYLIKDIKEHKHED